MGPALSGCRDRDNRDGVLIPIQIAVFAIWPIPQSVTAWYQLLQSSTVLGLMHLDVVYIVNNTIVALMYLAFYLSLRKRNESMLLISLLMGLLATAAYYASNPAFEMLSLSRQFVLSASEPERAVLLAAGQTLIAQWKGTAFDIYYILSAICLILISVAMFKSAFYSKAMAWIGLSSGVFMLIPSTVETIGVYFSLVSLIPWVVFSMLAAIRFFRLSKLHQVQATC